MLRSQVLELHNISHGSAGARSIAIMATLRGFKMGRWLAGKLMKELGLVSYQQPTHRYKRGGHEHIVIPNRLERQFAVTALAHRDWTRIVEIEIGLYSNRFEVISPGALNNSMSVEKMVAGQRSPRNTIIMEVLRDYGYVDFRGMGVRTKIIPLTQAMSGQLPEFTATDDYLKTILYRSPSS